MHFSKHVPKKLANFFECFKKVAPILLARGAKMRKVIKTIGLAVTLVTMSLGFTAAAVYAWDTEGTTKLLKEYEYCCQHEPESITPEYIEWLNAQLPDSEKVEGCCDFENHADDFEREDAILGLAMQLYDSAKANPNATVFDFDVYLDIARSVDESLESR